MSVTSSATSTITFTNTAAFGKMIGSGPERWQKKSEDDDPKCPRYASGFGSVKMLSENNFALTFHKFYSNEIKNLIRSI